MAKLRTQMVLLFCCVILQTKVSAFRRKSFTVPPVREVRALSSDKGDVLITWQHPGHHDVSSFIITWKMITLVKISDDGGNNNIQIKQDEIVDMLKGDNTNQNVLVLNSDQRSALLKNVTSPGSGIQACVTTKARKFIGQLLCSSLRADTGHVLPAPLNLHWTDVGLPGLIWEAVEGADSYLLQWEEDGQELGDITGVGGHSYSSGYSFRFDRGLLPGIWRITVRAIKDQNLGDAATYHKQVEGLTAHAKQVGKLDILLKWRVFPKEGTQNVTYDIVASQELGYKVMMLDFECSPLENKCETLISGVKFMTNRDITITVKQSSPAQLEAKTTLKLLSLPPKPSNLKLEMRNASGATITWDCIEPRHMAFYVVSVFKNKSKRSLLRKTSKLLTCSLELRQDDLIGALVEIEACLDQKHCSSASSLILKLNYKEKIKIRYHKSEKMGLSFTTFIILTSILMLLLMVILYVLIQRMEDTNNMSLITIDTMAYDEKMKFIYGHYD